MQQPKRPVFACRHHQKTSIKLTFVSTEEVHPEKVIGHLLNIIEVKKGNFCPHIKIEGGIDRFFLGNGCKIVSSSRKNLIPASLTNILEKVSKKSESEGNGEK